MVNPGSDKMFCPAFCVSKFWEVGTEPLVHSKLHSLNFEIIQMEEGIFVINNPNHPDLNKPWWIEEAHYDHMQDSEGVQVIIGLNVNREWKPVKTPDRKLPPR